jgi:hypothetical protein
MKSTLILLIACLPAVSLCQKGISVDISGTPMITYRTAGSFQHGGKQDEESKLNWSTGVNMNFQLTEHLYLRTGLSLMHYGYKSPELSEFRWGDQVNEDFEFDPSIMTMEPGPISAIQFAYNNVFIGIPISMRHQFNEQKWTPYFEARLVPSLYIRSATIQKTDLDKSVHRYSNSSSNFNTFRLIGKVSFGVARRISPQLSIFGQPTFSYFFTYSNKSSIKEHLYGVGLELGIRKSIGNAHSANSSSR